MAFQKCINLKKINSSINLSIDSSFINNKYGIEDIGLNTDNKKKRASKISVISDKDNFIYSVMSIKINETKKVDKRKKENKILKNKRVGFVHDVNTIQTSLDQINKIYDFKEIKLLGDKGYISQNKYMNLNKEVELITYKRKNQKENKKEIKETLKERIYVEITIGKLKKSERILTIKEHKIKNYMSFVYLGALINNLK